MGGSEFQSNPESRNITASSKKGVRDSIPSTAVTDKNTAYEQAHAINNNIIYLDQVTTRRREGLTVLFNTLDKQVTASRNAKSKRRDRIADELLRLPEERSFVRSVIIDNAVLDPVDREFINEVSVLHAEQRMDAAFARDDGVETALDNLGYRYENELGEKRHTVMTSLGAITFYVSRDTNSVRTEVPHRLNVQQPVNPDINTLNPHHTTLIVADCHHITRTLMRLEGHAGQICTDYAQAVDFSLINSSDPNHRWIVASALDDTEEGIRNVFGADEQTYVEVVLNAIYVSRTHRTHPGNTDNLQLYHA